MKPGALHVIFGHVIALLLLALCTPAQEPKAKADARFFADKVAPVLKRSCVECHNPGKTRGGLDLTSRATLMEGGDKGPVVVPGSADKSLLYQMVHGPTPKMPRQRDALTATEVADIARWIDGGAPWPDGVTLGEKAVAKGEAWWSLRPLDRPKVPRVKDRAWIKTDIDAFILATLETRGLKPSDGADRATFIRRVTYDLHGLPPTPEEIDAFVSDTAADAFEKLIDRLLASPRYGERWGRHWLDIVHYADTHGYDKDKRRLWAWLFRDWVIRALNQDMPYRRFVRSQLAGDVLFPGDPDGVIATGFVVAGPWDFVGHVELREGTVDKEKTRTLDRDDMVANTVSTFCSLTAHCARCHDHKFDPIPQKDYYRLQAVFAGVERGDRPVAAPDVQTLRASLEQKRHETAARHDAFVKKAAALASPELKRLDREHATLRNHLAKLPPPVAQQPSPTNGYHSAIEAKPDATKWVQVDLGRNIALDTVRLIPARPTDFADTPGFGFPLRFKVMVSDDANFKTAETLLDRTKEDYANPGDNALSIPAAGKKARYVRVTASRLWHRTNDNVFALAELQAYADGKNVAVGKTVTALDSIEAGRWSTRHLVDDFTSRHRLLPATDPATQDRLVAEAKLAATDHARRMEQARLLGPDLRAELTATARDLETFNLQLATLNDSMQVYAVQPIAPRPIHLLLRGDVERKGALVEPGALGLLPGLDRHFKAVKPNHEGSRRAALADWITDDANVLTWRSIVNRVWQFHFGKGLVDTPNDFGKNGSRPSHPELLDWLACEFRDSGGSFKQLHRTILLSAAYRQSSRHNAAAAKLDADNRLVWRMSRQRLDAEALRDSVLAVSGKLDLKMYGPGFELFRFKDDHSPIYDHLDLTRINAPDTWRRTVYRFVVRSVPNPFLESLDCADPNINVPVRSSTMTALQALALLNNPFMVKQSEFFADRVAKLHADPERQVDAAYRLAFGRLPDADERTAMAAYVRRHGLANACRLMFNANEFLFVD